jgi:hypothetical protein
MEFPTLPPEGELVAGMDDWSSVQAQSVLPSGGSQYSLTVLGGGEIGPPTHRKLGIPAPGDEYNVFGKRVSRARYKEMLNAAKTARN